MPPKIRRPFIKTKTVLIPKGFDFENAVTFIRKGKRKLGISFSRKIRRGKR